MSDPKTLTFALMDAPFESARSTTALRLIDCAVKRGFKVNVFAYEGAVYLPLAGQKPHANAVHGHDVEQEDHPLPREWVAAIMRQAARNGAPLDWVNCGLCVDERGAEDAVEGVRRGTPADFWAMAEASENTLVIATN
ncbi:MAG: DsrE family protein [Kiloniellales bacterium]|nr:DsrE family protein [Kiloniellales bacterium]